MLKIVAVEGNLALLDEINDIIKSTMIDNDIAYETYLFKHKNKALDELIKSDGIKIYILDVDVAGGCEIEVIRRIRTEDYNSIIIIVSSIQVDLVFTIIKQNLCILNFISKTDNFKINLEETLKLAIKILSNKKELTKITNYGIKHFIVKSDILYIERIKLSKKCIVKTTNKEYYIYKSLIQLEKELEFQRFNKSYIINVDRIKSKKKDYILFDNGTKIKTTD